MRRFVLLCLLALTPALTYAQGGFPDGYYWYLGAEGGLSSGGMSVTHLDKEVFPSSGEKLNSGVFSVFVERYLGKEGHFSIRPTLTWLERGGTLPRIYDTDAFGTYYEDNGLSNVLYRLKASYLDLRVPLMFQFGSLSNTVRPYLYVAPIIGLPMNGKISMEQQYLSGDYNGYALDVSKGNLASLYYSAAFGAGLKWNILRHNLYLAFDISYDPGFCNTYSKKEKEGSAIVKENLFYNAYAISGTRKLSGLEVKVSVGIPLGRKKAAPRRDYQEPVTVRQEPRQEPVVPRKPNKPCYSLDEISDMIDRGVDVQGKTFCAVDAIQFEFGKSTIMQSSQAYLDQLARILIRTGMRVEVKGHTDNVGSEDVNLKLSKERAQAVMNYLIKKGVPKNKLSFSYYGMSKPLFSNDTEDGRRWNRRVEFEILK